MSSALEKIKDPFIPFFFETKRDSEKRLKMYFYLVDRFRLLERIVERKGFLRGNSHHSFAAVMLVASLALPKTAIVIIFLFYAIIVALGSRLLSTQRKLDRLANRYLIKMEEFRRARLPMRFFKEASSEVSLLGLPLRTYLPFCRLNEHVALLRVNRAHYRVLSKELIKEIIYRSGNEPIYAFSRVIAKESDEFQGRFKRELKDLEAELIT